MDKRKTATLWWDESPDWLIAKIPGVVVVAFPAQGALERASDFRALAAWLAEAAIDPASGSHTRMASAAAFALPFLYRVPRTAIFRAHMSGRRLRVPLLRRTSVPAERASGRALPSASDLASLLASSPSPDEAAKAISLSPPPDRPHGNNPKGRGGKPATSFVNDCGERLSLPPGSEPLATRGAIASEWLRRQPGDGPSYWSMAVAMAAKTHDLNAPWIGLCRACGMDDLGKEALRAFAEDVRKAQGR